MSETSTFGDRIRELRVKCGLSQEEAAARLGVSPQSVSKWETDKCYPEFLLIMPLARLYGVSADQLLGSEDRRAYWENQWQEALRKGGEQATLPVTEAALKELPEDSRFRYRQGCTEWISALSAETEEEKRRWLAAAEKHLRALHQDEPMNESAAGMLATVLLALDRRQEAAEILREMPGGERQLATVLEGEEQKRQYRRVVTASFRQLFADLISYHTPEALRAAERIIHEVLGAEGFFVDILVSVFWEKAKNELGAGREEAAVAALTAIRDLRKRWDGAGGYDKAPETAPFLEPHYPAHCSTEYWVSLLSMFRDPTWAPLRDRPDFQALLKEAESQMTEEE